MIVPYGLFLTNSSVVIDTVWTQLITCFGGINKILLYITWSELYLETIFTK